MYVMKLLIGVCVVFFAQATAQSNDTSWVWNYKIRFTEAQMQENAGKPYLYFQKTDVPHFSQMIFSWNIFRPDDGYFTFFSKTRDAKTQEWSEWHRMIDWGQGIQRSYEDHNAGDTSHYLHVRLEIQQGHLADGFSVKIVKNGGACLDHIKALAVCTADFNKFKSEELTAALLSLPSVYVHNVPRKSQRLIDHPRSGHMCSPTSCSMVTGFFTGKDIDPRGFAERVYDAGMNAYGAWPFNTAHAFERCAGSVFFFTTRMKSFKNLYNQLRRGIPMVVSVRGYLEGAPKIYESGHLLVVVGYDAQQHQVICHDPALPTDQATLKKYDVKSFLLAWERSHRLAYYAEPNKAATQG
jgi:hypothetical protein